MIVLSPVLKSYIFLLDSGKSMDEICEVDLGNGPMTRDEAAMVFNQLFGAGDGDFEDDSEPLGFTASDPRASEIVEGFFIKDHFSHQCQQVQKQVEFLFTGRRPQVGQHVQVQVALPGGDWGRLSGQVTRIGPPPEDEVFMQGFWGQHSLEDCNDPECVLNALEEKTPENLRSVIECQMGALHGQIVVCNVSLNFDFHHKTELVAFFEGAEKQWDLELICDDEKESVWVGKSIAESVGGIIMDTRN